MLYPARYIATGDLCDAWYSIGCVSAHLNRLIVVLLIAVAEIAALAIDYDYERRIRIQRLAIIRDIAVGFYQLLSVANTEIKQHVGSEIAKKRAPRTKKTLHEQKNANGKWRHPLRDTQYQPTRGPSV